MYTLPPLYSPGSANQVSEQVYSTRIEGLYYFAHKTARDERGFFSELARFPELETAIGKPYVVKQISHARSKQHVARGFHAENWTKYVQVVGGLCFSAIADVRPESPTFLTVEYFLFGQGGQALDGSLYVPPRLGNSMCALEGPVDYVYLFDMLYQDRDPGGDVAISLFDPDLHVKWPIAKEQMIISERDTQAVTLREKYPEKFTD